MTPTPEQMPSFKEWFEQQYKHREFNPNFTPHLEELCTAHHNHCLMNDPGFQSNAELRRKLAALQDRYVTEVLRSSSLQEQLTASQERCKELEIENDKLRKKFNISHLPRT